jgi:hypothetical protein
MRRTFVCFCLVITLLLAGCSPAQPAGRLQVIAHPDGPLYVGDQVSFEVLAPAASGEQSGSIQVTFQGQDLGQASIAPFGMGSRNQATLWWVWDTRGLKPGRYAVTFTRLPDKFSWTETYSLRPESQVPPPQPGAHWAYLNTACCIIHYITGTAAARDINVLGREADLASAAVAKQMGITLNKPIDVTLMSRVLGQGGFTSNSVYLSYLDGNYTGDEMPILFHHEFVHYYDAIEGGKYRPPFFEEGLAVYLSGGHFKPEPLVARADALLTLGGYIPLTTVANNFYNQQHDISYLEAATLVKYMVETYGWADFNQFYRDISAPEKGQSDSAVIDAALQAHFKRSFADLESAYLAYLRRQAFTEEQRADLQVTVKFFDTVRRYQEALDPSAYFLYAWLPDGSVMRQRNIVADLVRHPAGWQNRLSEALLERAHAEWFSGDYAGAERTLQWTNWLLNILAP